LATPQLLLFLLIFTFSFKRKIHFIY